MNIAFIPVRGGSKSIPLKNIKPFCGEPLVYWTIKAAIDAKHVDKVVVSTDHPAIKSYALSLNHPKIEVFDRSIEHAQDHSSTESAMLEYLDASPNEANDYFLLLQATSPFTTAQMIDEAFGLLQSNAYDSVLSGTRFKRFIWSNEGTPINYDFTKRPRRQDFEGLFLENGAFYWSTVGRIKQNKNRLSGKIGQYEMPEYTSVEIDELDDWLISEKLFLKHHKSNKQYKTTIKLFLTDVDGVLTDAGMYYTESGDELKKFNTHDGMGFELLRKAGIKTGIVTSEDTQIVARRAAKLKVDHLYQGKKDGGKLAAAKEICEKEGLTLKETAYIGDDINCLELLSNVGLAACPVNAVEKIKSIPGIIQLTSKGGDGAVREFVEYILTI